MFYSVVCAFAVLCVFNYGTSYYLFNEHDIKTNLKVHSVHRFVFNRYIKADEVVMSLDLSYDMTKAFNWNLKQLFVYVLATYKTPIHDRNEVIIHDSIITKKQNAKKSFKNMLTEYSLKDYSNHLRNNTIELQVCYKYMPYVGFAKTYKGHKISYKLPAEYFDRLPTSYPVYYPDK